MKKFYFSALSIVMILALTACGHTHTWEEATCTTPKTCSTCGETEGEPLGHTVENWETITEPTCTVEGTKSGK